MVWPVTEDSSLGGAFAGSAFGSAAFGSFPGIWSWANAVPAAASSAEIVSTHAVCFITALKIAEPNRATALFEPRKPEADRVKYDNHRQPHRIHHPERVEIIRREEISRPAQRG